jgi:hypothetical protein
MYSVVNTTSEGLLYWWYAIDNKLHVSAIRFLTSFENKKQAKLHFFGAEISDRLRRLNGIIKPRTVKS